MSVYCDQINKLSYILKFIDAGISPEHVLKFQNAGLLTDEDILITAEYGISAEEISSIIADAKKSKFHRPKNDENCIVQ